MIYVALVGLVAVVMLITDAYTRMAEPKKRSGQIVIRNPAHDDQIEQIVRAFFRRMGRVPAFAGRLTVEIQNGIVPVNETQTALGRYDGSDTVYLYANVIRWARATKHRDNTLPQFVGKVLTHELGHFFGLTHGEFDRVQG